ncbi:hypothetical protein EON66_09980, partial [archaeon]
DVLSSRDDAAPPLDAVGRTGDVVAADKVMAAPDGSPESSTLSTPSHIQRSTDLFASAHAASVHAARHHAKSVALAAGRQDKLRASLATVDAPSHLVHVVIFMNGLGGSTHDTRLLRSYLKLHFPDLYCYVTTSNQHKHTEGDLVGTAVRVAQEWFELLSVQLAQDKLEAARVSFVCFSIGGVVARLALRHPYMKPFLPLCHAFVSIASPHLGMLYAQSSLISAGLYVVRQVRKSAALSQLSFTDESGNEEVGIRNCLLYLMCVGWSKTQARHGALRRASLTRAPVESEDTALGVLERGSLGSAQELDVASDVEEEPRVRIESEHASTLSSEAADALPGPAQASDFASLAEVLSGPPSSRRLGSLLDLSRVTPSTHNSSPGSQRDGSQLAPAAASAGAGAASSPHSVLPVTLARLDALHFNNCSNGYIMSYFRHVHLISSEQDAYAPESSCAVQWCDA